MDSKSTIWIAVAVLLIFVLMDGSKTTRTTTTARTSSPYPVGGPSPLGTSWAQSGPYAPASSQTNGYDLAVAGVNAVGQFGKSLAESGYFNGTDGTSDSYDTGYIDNSVPVDG